jgi:hypothetical protein
MVLPPWVLVQVLLVPPVLLRASVLALLRVSQLACCCKPLKA